MHIIVAIWSSHLNERLVRYYVYDILSVLQSPIQHQSFSVHAPTRFLVPHALHKKPLEHLVFESLLLTVNLLTPEPLMLQKNKSHFDLTVYLTLIRSEEHTSELQSRFDLVCRLLLETN